MSEVKMVVPGQIQRAPNLPATGIVKRIFRQEYMVLLLVLLGVIAAFAGISKGVTLTESNIASVWTQSSSRGIASIGQLFVILAGGIDISVGGNALMCAIIGAKLMTGLTGGVPTGPIVIVLLAGLAVGLANGGLVSRVGIPALIATLGVWQMTDGAAVVGSQFASFQKVWGFLAVGLSLACR